MQIDDLKKDLIGKKIERIFISEKYLRFITDKGPVTYKAEGDCCSQSVFYDFYGVKKLFENGKVIAVSGISLSDEERNEKILNDKKNYQESIDIYGYDITTVSEEFGEMTSAFSFRNYSNGYYGGSMREVFSEENINLDGFEIFDDLREASNIPYRERDLEKIKE